MNILAFSFILQILINHQDINQDYIQKPLIVETQITQEGSIIKTFSEDVEQWRELVSKHFPTGVVDEALQILFCESRGDPNATNLSGATGLFQIIPYPQRGTHEELLFPEWNVKVASEIFADSQWNQWSCKP